MTFSPPQGRCTRWLLKAGTDVPDEVRNALIQSLYGTLPIYAGGVRSEEHTSELQSLMRISYAVFCLKKKKLAYTISNYTEHRHDHYESETNQLVPEQRQIEHQYMQCVCR